MLGSEGHVEVANTDDGWCCGLLNQWSNNDDPSILRAGGQQNRGEADLQEIRDGAASSAWAGHRQ